MRGLLLYEPDIHQTSTEDLKCASSVLGTGTVISGRSNRREESVYLMLAALVLHGDGDAGRYMREPYSGLGLVDVLSACAACAHDFEANILHLVERLVGFCC